MEYIGEARKSLVGGWIVGYVEFPEAKTRRQAGFLLKINEWYLFDVSHKGFLASKDCLRDGRSFYHWIVTRQYLTRSPKRYVVLATATVTTAPAAALLLSVLSTTRLYDQ
jgi:hypothetical protein